MNRLILSLTLLAAGMLPAAAQHYRGFFDASFNMPLSNSNDWIFDDAKGFTFSATTSHGVQLNKLFIGAGAGALYTCSSYGVGIPVFADIRYDFFNFSAVNLFIGCKAGYSFASTENDMHMLFPKPDDIVGRESFFIADQPIYDESGQQIGHTQSLATQPYSEFQGIYIQPSIGVRFRLNATMGLNLTLSYLPLQMKSKHDIEYRTNILTQDEYTGDMVNHYQYRTERDAVVGKFWSHRIALSVGIDF